jgi:hypothetical protein
VTIRAATIALIVAIAACATAGPVRISAAHQDAAGELRVDVVDQTGQLRRVYFPTEEQLVASEVTADGIGLGNAPGNSRILQVTWVTERCPPPQTFVIARLGARFALTIDGGRRVCAEDVGVFRTIQLEFATPVPASLVDPDNITVRS